MPTQSQIGLGFLLIGLVACEGPDPDKPAGDGLLHEVRITDTGNGETGSPGTETGEPHTETGEPEPVVDLDGDGYSPADGDCDDTKPTVHPGAAEWCDGVDNDCNGLTDEVGSIGATTWYHDADRDGYGDDEDVVLSCVALLGYAEVGGDCDDDDATVNPDGTETCNGSDDDCDGTIDNGFEMTTYYRDADGDLRGDALSPLVSCLPPAGYVANTFDCDDTDTDIHSEMPELCDEKDNDCNGLVDDDVATYWFYRDVDGDEVGDASDAVEACDRPSGYVIDPGDCDDTDSTVYPGAWEHCNGVDDDCSGVIDDGLAFTTFYADMDGDGFGDIDTTVEACAVPEGYTSDSTDCDDTRDWVNPDIEADCADGVDEDCDGEVDEGPDRTWYADSDGDGYGDLGSPVVTCVMPEGYTPDSTDCDDSDADFSPEAREVCGDGMDSDCDGLLDDDDPDCDCPDHGIELDEDIGTDVGSSVRTGTTSGMGDDIDGSCGSSGGQDYVMFWEAPEDGCYEITTDGSDFDTLLLIYHGCDGYEIGCNDDGGEGLRSRLVLSSVEAGDIYFLVVDGYSSFSSGSFVLNINDC